MTEVLDYLRFCRQCLEVRKLSDSWTSEMERAGTGRKPPAWITVPRILTNSPWKSWKSLDFESQHPSYLSFRPTLPVEFWFLEVAPTELTRRSDVSGWVEQRASKSFQGLVHFYSHWVIIVESYLNSRWEIELPKKEDLRHFGNIGKTNWCLKVDL